MTVPVKVKEQVNVQEQVHVKVKVKDTVKAKEQVNINILNKSPGHGLKPTPPRGLVKHIRIGMTQTTIVMCIIAAIVSLQSSLTSSPFTTNNMAIDDRVLTVHMFARSMPETVLRMHSSSRIINTYVRCTLHNTVSSKSVAAFYFSFPLW